MSRYSDIEFSYSVCWSLLLVQAAVPITSGPHWRGGAAAIILLPCRAFHWSGVFPHLCREQSVVTGSRSVIRRTAWRARCCGAGAAVVGERGWWWHFWRRGSRYSNTNISYSLQYPPRPAKPRRELFVRRGAAPAPRSHPAHPVFGVYSHFVIWQTILETPIHCEVFTILTSDIRN